jgi:hypothetical protein
MTMMASGLFAAAAILTMAVAAPAVRAQDLGSTAETPAQEASDRATVVTLVGKAKAEPRRLRAGKAKPKDRFLFAVVRFDGSLARGHGVKNTFRMDLGSYQVFFNRDVTECGHVVSVSGFATDDVHGVADSAQIGGKPKGLYVNTFDIAVENNQLKRGDASFHLQVMCPPG